MPPLPSFSKIVYPPNATPADRSPGCIADAGGGGGGGAISGTTGAGDSAAGFAGVRGGAEVTAVPPAASDGDRGGALVEDTPEGTLLCRASDACVAALAAACGRAAFGVDSIARSAGLSLLTFGSCRSKIASWNG